MSTQRGKSRARSEAAAGRTDAGGSPPRWRGFLLSRLLGAALSPITGLAAAIPLGFACIFLILGWTFGPQRAIDAAPLRAYTAHAEGRIVQSWLGLDFDPADMGKYRLWRPWAHAAQCVVVDYDIGWGDARGGTLERAFCGLRLQYSESYDFADFRELTKGVPFAWLRDERGFAVPEVRLSSKARAWLESHPEPDPLPIDPPTANALESLRLDHDRPVELAIAGWMTPTPATIPLLYDPRHPRAALPAGEVAERLDLPPTPLLWVLFLVLLVPGAFAWIEGMAFLLGGMPRWAFWFVALVPILAVPWWAGNVPRFVGRLNARMGEVVQLLLADALRGNTATASDPAQALLANGERLVWRLQDSRYKDTLGRLHFEPPAAPPPSKEAAERRLRDTVTAEVEALPEPERAALFDRLRDEKEGKLEDAGPLFLIAARDAALAADASPALQSSARRLLEAWGHPFPPYSELAPTGAAR